MGGEVPTGMPQARGEAGHRRGARVDGEEVVIIARNLRGYSNLCRLLSFAHADQPKGELARPSRKLPSSAAISSTSARPTTRNGCVAAETLGKENVSASCITTSALRDSWVLEGRAAMAKRCGAQIVATNEVQLPRRRAKTPA